MRPIQIVTPPLLDHERRVREMMAGFGQAVPDLPTVADEKTRVLRTRLLLEEVFEYAEAAGITVTYRQNNEAPDQQVSFDNLRFYAEGDVDLAGMADAVADISVVNTGTAAAHGIRLAPILEAVDANNLMKVANGRLDEHGKFIKPADHKPTNIEFMLQLQGWQPNDEDRECDANTESSRAG